MFKKTEAAAGNYALRSLDVDVQSGFSSPLFCVSPMLILNLECFSLLCTFKERKRHFIDNRKSTPHHSAD